MDIKTLSTLIIFCVAGILSLGLSIYGMILFTSKMYELVKTRKTTIYSDDDEVEIELNLQQQRLLYATAKYLTLLSLAIFSSWVGLVVIVRNCIQFSVGGDVIEVKKTPISEAIAVSLATMDSTINVICLYLAYPFSNKYYNKYCICFSKCCTYLLNKMTVDEMKNEKAKGIHGIVGSVTMSVTTTPITSYDK